MAALARCGAGNPLAFSGVGCDTAIQCCCQLQRNQRAVFLDTVEEAFIYDLRFGGANTGFDLQPRLAQHGQSLAGNPRIRIGDGDNNPADAGVDQCTGARIGFAGMATGFQADVCSGTTCQCAGTW